ncbi:MAG: hypothetical protein GVX78_02005 [Bacteroidetes bacterium]|jgi:hypothetical protein|nr:hypothetical protein [Bacteroidota bacterium]
MEGQQKQKRSTLSMLWRGLKRILLGLLIFWVLLTIAIQIPAVQGYIIDRVANSISQQSETTVRAEGFRLKLFNRFRFKICI